MITVQTGVEIDRSERGAAKVIGTSLNGRFLLESELGRGGMGTVYRALDSILQRPVAIKLLKDLSGEEVGRKVRMEAQILARLVHHNVVRLYDFNVEEETYYFIMEVVDGASFARRMRKISLGERLRVVAEVAEALDYAHHQGVIHRDVKPGNILLTSQDQAKLSDFGLSMLQGDEQQSGIVRGTPHYMSPEQARGRKIDHRTDLYALGVILYECATGAPPFSGPVMSVMSQHIHGQAEPPRSKNPEASEELEALIQALMAKDPDDRPASGLEVSARVRALSEIGRDPAASGQVAIPTSFATAMRPAPQVVAAARAKGPIPKPVPSDRLAARAVVEAVEAEPIQLSPDERYLHGHYLAYLIGGSRRRGFLLRRPLDPLNADRARLLLAMAALSLEDSEAVDMKRAAAVLDQRFDVRPMLSPVVVAKYLLGRSNPARRKRFRQLRQQLQQSSERAARHLTDDAGVLNPGLMPQSLNDLRRLAPERTEVDDHLVERWNRVADVWRNQKDFRLAVLGYATRNAARDPASLELWPEVVYPLIERARRQRQLRSGTEAFRDAVFGAIPHVGDVGTRLDRVIRTRVPVEVIRSLDVEIARIVDELAVESALAVPPPAPEPAESLIRNDVAAASFHDLEVESPTRQFVRFIKPDPVRLNLGDLRIQWREAIEALKRPGVAPPQQHVPLGLYRLVVIASIRSKSAGQLAIQGMANKQIEMLVPSFQVSGPATKIVAAIWIYANNSLAITYLDNLNDQKFIVWDAPIAQQTNFDDPAGFNSTLYNLGLEVPDQLDRVLTRSYREHAPD